jgi:alginate O-acetyltransferase complex protein AlgJ
MHKGNRIYSALLSLFFVCWIFFPVLNGWFRFFDEPVISKSENRTLAKRPVFDVAFLDPYPKKYEFFYNDHFIFRQHLLHFNALIKYFLFRKSPSPEDVAVGKEGWFYLAQKDKSVFTGTYFLSNDQVLEIAKELSRRTILLARKGIRFYVAFAPTKPEIYPEFLPPDYRRSPTGTVTEKVTAMVGKIGGVNLIYLKTPLLEAKKYGMLFLKTDNHWNKIGSYYAYREIAERIREDYPAVKVIEKTDVRFRDTIVRPGNLAIMSGLSEYLTETEIIPTLRSSRARPGEKVGYKPPNSEIGDYFEIVRETGDTSLPGVLVIRDSFTNALAPYLDETFRKTVYIFDGWKYGLNQEIVDHEHPDIVLLIIYEPHIPHVVDLP